MVQPNGSWQVLRLANLSYIRFGLQSVLSPIKQRNIIREYFDLGLSPPPPQDISPFPFWCKRKPTLGVRCEGMVAGTSQVAHCSIQQVPTQLQWLIVDKIKMLQKCENFSKTGSTATWLSCGYHISMVELWSVRNNNKTTSRNFDKLDIIWQ